MTSVGWAPEQTRRFFRAFHKYGTEFDKVARVVAGGKGAELCEALYRSHQAYLSLDKSFQSEVAFVSMVQDAARHSAQAKKEEDEDEHEQIAVVEQRLQQQQQQQRRRQDGLTTAAPASLLGAAALDGSANLATDQDDNDDAAAARQQEQQHIKQVEEGQGEEEEEEEGEEEEAKVKQTLAAGRARRTPKRPLHFDQQQEATAAAATAAGRILSPTSTGKRARAVRSASKASNAGNDMYYYDEGFGAITESARKRRASQKRLDFESGLAIGGDGSHGYHTAGRHHQQQQQQQQQGKRKDNAAEHHGIHALLALAAADGGDDEAMLMGEEGEGEEEEGYTGGIGTLGGLQGRGLQQLYNSDFDSERDFLSDDDDDDDEQDAGALVEDEDDMDFETELKRKGRRTPHATPHKGKGGRPGSAHTTPRRQNQGGGGVPGSGRGGGASGRALLASPGVLKSLASPHVLGGGAGYGDEGIYGHHLGGEGMNHLLHHHLGGYGAPGSGPGGGGMGRGTAAAVAAAAVARFGNRLAARAKLKKRLRRKRPIQKSIAYILPIRSLFGRRQSLNSSMGGSAAQSLLAAAAGNVGSYGEEVPAGIPMTPPEAAMRHALNARARKWAGIEFVTCAVDRPWLMAGSSMLTGLAEQVGLGGNVKLTRKEWSMLKSAAFGRPRRLSRAFLNDERVRLEYFREAARLSYQPPGGGGKSAADVKEQQGEQEVVEANGTETSIVEEDTTPPAAGVGGVAVEGDTTVQPEKEPAEPAVTIIKPTIPVETLPKRLNVGQKVVALHPNTGQLHDGTILTAAPQWYRIQFDRRELGVEPVRDTDLMPADPWLNLPSNITDAAADGEDEGEDGDGGKRSVITLNGRHYVNGVFQKPPAPITKTGSVKRLDRPGSNAAAMVGVGGTPPHMLHGTASGATPGSMGMGLGMGMGVTTPGVAGSLGLGGGGGGGSGAMGTAMVINPAATPYAMAAAAAAGMLQQQQQQRAAANEGLQKKLQAELAVLLDKKEALLGKLKEMNNKVETEKRKGKRVGIAAAAATAKTPNFVEAYAEVVLTLKGVNDEIHEKLAEFGKFGLNICVGSSLKAAAAAAGPSLSSAASPDDKKGKDEEKKEEREDGEGEIGAEGEEDEEKEAAAKVPIPLTNPAELQSLSHLEAWAVVSSCRQKMAEDRRTEGSSDDIDAIILPNVMNLIQSCVTTLVMLQQGSERGVSMSVLTQGLEASLKTVKPKSKENQELFGEVQAAMKQLKTLLLASDK